MLKYSEIDMLFDADKRELSFCIVGNCNDKNQGRMFNMKCDKENGFVPHFNVYYAGAKLRIAQIPPYQYGKKIDNLFP